MDHNAQCSRPPNNRHWPAACQWDNSVLAFRFRFLNSSTERLLLHATMFTSGHHSLPICTVPFPLRLKARNLKCDWQQAGGGAMVWELVFAGQNWVCWVGVGSSLGLAKGLDCLFSMDMWYKWDEQQKKTCTKWKKSLERIEREESRSKNREAESRYRRWCDPPMRCLSDVMWTMSRSGFLLDVLCNA